MNQNSSKEAHKEKDKENVGHMPHTVHVQSHTSRGAVAFAVSGVSLRRPSLKPRSSNLFRRNADSADSSRRFYVKPAQQRHTLRGGIDVVYNNTNLRPSGCVVQRPWRNRPEQATWTRIAGYIKHDGWPEECPTDGTTTQSCVQRCTGWYRTTFYCFVCVESQRYVFGCLSRPDLRRGCGLSTNPYPVHRLDKVRTEPERSAVVRNAVFLHRRAPPAFWSSRARKPWHASSHSNFARTPSRRRTSRWCAAMQGDSR